MKFERLPLLHGCHSDIKFCLQDESPHSPNTVEDFYYFSLTEVLQILHELQVHNTSQGYESALGQNICRRLSFLCNGKCEITTNHSGELWFADVIGTVSQLIQKCNFSSLDNISGNLRSVYFYSFYPS